MVLTSHLRQAVPGVHFVDFPDVVLSSEDGEQARVGVVELNKNIIEHFICMSLLMPDTSKKCTQFHRAQDIF